MSRGMCVFNAHCGTGYRSSHIMFSTYLEQLPYAQMHIITTAEKELIDHLFLNSVAM